MKIGFVLTKKNRHRKIVYQGEKQITGKHANMLNYC